jgi:hypothetical protein
LGHQQAVIEVHVYARLSRHNSEEDIRDNALFDELRQRITTAVEEIVNEPKYKPIEANVV